MSARPITRFEQFNTPAGPCVLAYQVSGDGPSLLLIHGLAGSGRWWARNVEALSRHFRVYVVDLIGFGRSHAGRHGRRFGLSDAADVLTTFMDRVAIDRASIIGHSMGGHIALVLAADAPERVDRLILVDAAALPIDRGRPGHLISLTRALFRSPLSFLPVLAADVYRAGLATIWRAAREVLGADIRTKLTQITSPTLVIWGERDTIIPTSLARPLAASLPGAVLTIIAGAGHNPMWEQPAIFNRVVLDFLQSDHWL